MSDFPDAHHPFRFSYDQIIYLGEKLASFQEFQLQKRFLENFLKENFGGESSIWLKYRQKKPIQSEFQPSYPFDPYSILSNELFKENNFLIYKEHGLTWTIFPLRQGEENFGLIIIESKDDYKNEELSLLSNIASVSALAIYGCLQTQLKNWRQKQLSLVRSVTAQISQITRLETLSQKIVELVQETFGYYYVAIFLVDQDTGRLHFMNSAGSDQSDRPEFENENHPGFALGEHIIGHVAKTGVEVIANDVTLEPRYQIVDSLADTKSEAVLPLQIETEILGVFDVQSDILDAFDEDDLLVLRALADNIAIAIESTRLYQEAHNRAEQLSAVSEVSRSITSILDSDKLLQRIVDLINERFGFPYVHIFTIDPVQNELKFRAGAGERTRFYAQAEVTYDLNAGKGILPAVVQEKKTKRVNNVEEEPLFLKSPFAQKISGSEMAVPLIFGNEVLGVLDIQSDQKDAFSSDHQRLMETLGDNLAIAIRNARLYRSEKWRRQVAESLRDVAGLLSENADLQEVMDAILKQLHRNLPCDIAGIWLFENDSQIDESIEARKMYLAAYQIAETFPQNGLDRITFAPDEWVKNALEQKKPTIRKPEDPIGPLGQKFGLNKDYSSIAAPLHTGGKILGMLTLIHHTPGRYGPETEKITSAFASYAAISIENNRLYQTSQEQAWISTILLQVAQATQSLKTLDELVGTIVRLTPMVVGIKGCAIFLREPNSDRFTLFDIYGIETNEEVSGFDLPYPVMDAPLLQDLLLTHQPMKVLEPEQDLNLPVEIAKSMEKNTLILLPLVSRDELLGAILLANDDQSNPDKSEDYVFSEDQLKIVQGIIQQSAVAIENIRLFEDRQEEAYVSTVLLQSAEAIVSGGTLGDILDTIVNILPILVGIDSSAIYLWNENEKLFQITHAIAREDTDIEELVGETYQFGDFPMLDTVLQNNQPVVHPFIENTLPLEDWDLVLPDESQTDPTPFLVSRYPLLMGFPLSVKDEVFGVLLAQDENFSTNRQRRFELIYGIAQQVSLAIQNDRLNKEMLDRQRLEREFQLAREIQQTFLPDKMPKMPGWQMAVHWETARQVGGDFYDYFRLPDGRIAVVIADVSDKGLAASLYMTVTRTLLRAAALEANSPSKTLEKVNDLLLTNSQNGLFVTTFYGILSLETGVLEYTIAGHNPPLVIKYDTKEVIELDRGGIALGALPDISLIDQKVILKPGDCLVLYTDGVTEAFNLEDQMYGEDRLKSVLVNSCGKSARYILEIIEENLEEFRGDAPLSDDTTILAICNAKSLTNKHRDLGSP